MNRTIALTASTILLLAGCSGGSAETSDQATTPGLSSSSVAEPTISEVPYEAPADLSGIKFGWYCDQDGEQVVALTNDYAEAIGAAEAGAQCSADMDSDQIDESALTDTQRAAVDEMLTVTGGGTGMGATWLDVIDALDRCVQPVTAGTSVVDAQALLAVADEFCPEHPDLAKAESVTSP